MEYFTFKVKDLTGFVIFETDFTLKEFLPQISRVLASLGDNAYLSDLLQNCKIVITPHYEGTPKSGVFILPQTDASTQQEQDEVLRISPDEIPEEPYNPSSSYVTDPYNSEQFCRSCEGCPTRNYCSELHQKVMLDPDAQLRNEPVHYFTIRVESEQGDRLYQQDFSGQIIQDFGVQIFQHLIRTGDMSTKIPDQHWIEIFVHRDGTPRINPAILSQPKIRAYRVVLDDMPEERMVQAEQAPPHPPGMMVNWDQVEAKQDQEDLNITFISTEENKLDTKAMPSLEESHPIGTISKTDLHIFIRQSVVDTLKKNIQGVDSKHDGVLIGNAYIDATDNRPFVEIVGMISEPAASHTVGFTLDYALWRLVEKRLTEEFPGNQTIGWYRVKKLNTPSEVMYTTENYNIIYKARLEQIILLSEEHFVHETFFREIWQIGLLADSEKGTLHFFQRKGKEIVECSGYFIVNN